MPQESTFSFLQISELLLDSKLASKVLTLSPAQRQERNEECLEILIRLCKEAASRQVDAILIPGGLWDAASVTNTTAARLIELFASIPNIAVVIVPGASDAYTVDGLHNSGVLAARGLKPWSDNVLPMTNTSFETVLHPTRKDVTFTARAMASATDEGGAFSTGFPALSRMPIRILLLPARLANLEENSEMNKVCVPPYKVDVDQLDAAGFTYTAFSGFHNFHMVRNSVGKLLGAYAGSLIGRTVQEAGARNALWGRVIITGNEVIVTVDPVELDARKVVVTSCSITGIKPEQLQNTVKQVLAKDGARERDIVLLKLTGMYPHGDPPVVVDAAMREAFYHLILDDRTRPDYLGARPDERTTEGKFIQTLLEMKHRAELKGGALPDTEYGTELSTKVIEDALYYGLQALKERKVAVRNVD